MARARAAASARRSTASRTPPRCGGSRPRRRPLQHPEHRHLPLAAVAPTAHRARPLVAADAPGALPLRPARAPTSRCSAAAAEDDITHLAEPLDVPLPLDRRRRARAATSAGVYGTGASSLLLREPGAPPRRSSTPIPSATIRICDLSDDPTRGTRGWAHEPQPAHVRRGRPGARPRRLPRGAGRRRDAARDLPLRLRAEIGGGGYDRGDLDGRAGTRRSAPSPTATARAAARRASPAAARSRSSTAAVRADAARRRRRAEPSERSRSRAPPTARGRCSRAATSSGSRWSPTRRRAQRARARRRAARSCEASADTAPRKLVLRHCTLVPGLDARPRRQPDVSPARRA